MVDKCDALESTVERFLSRGKLGNLTIDEMAGACDKRIRAEVENSVTTAVTLGRQFTIQAAKHGGAIYVTALRVFGWVSLVAGQYRQAEKAYLEARGLLRGSAIDRARIDRVLIDIYMYLADFGEARRRARTALAVFRRLNEPADIARTEVNYANLLHRQDLHTEAQTYYKQAADYFEKAGPPVAVALCYYNLANTQVQLFHFDNAGETYSKAKTIFEEHNQSLHATGCLYGLAWLHMLQGDFHVALTELAECERRYRAGGNARELVLCQLDQAETYLGLNLLSYARQAAEGAAAGASQLGIAYEEAKGNFFAGVASLRMGQRKDAHRALRAARDGFEIEKNQGFLAAVDMALMQLESRDRPEFASLLQTRAKLQESQLPLWEAMCDLQILALKPDDQSALDRLSHNRATEVVPHLAARRFALMGDRAARLGRTDDAVALWTRSAELLEGLRAKLPPAEMRSTFLSRLSDPYENLISTRHDTDPLTGALWSERLRNAGLWSASGQMLPTSSPARAAAAASLSALAEQVAAISQSTVGRQGTRSTGVFNQSQRLNSLQTDVHKAMLTLDSGGSTAFESTDELSDRIGALSGELPIVHFHIGRKDVIGFVHYRGGVRTWRYDDGVEFGRKLAAEWRFLVERAPSLPEDPNPSHVSDENRVLDRISHWLLDPLELPTDSRRVLVVPEGFLANLPWWALKFDGLPLVDRYELALSPSIRHHLYARSHAGDSRQVRVFVGDTTGLQSVDQEVSSVLSGFESFDTSCFFPCTRDDWPDKDQALVWHFVGHAQLRADNPFYSALMLSDGPMFAADFRLKQCSVRLVMLAACRTGQQSGRAGEENAGLVRSLLEMGARSVVASHWAVADRSAGPWSVEMYNEFLGGASVTRAAQAATLRIRERFPSAYHWSAFSVFGAW